MLAQGVLGFQYEAETSSGGLTSLAGLPLYLDLIHASGLGTAIRQQVRVAGAQGWLDIQMVLAVIFLKKRAKPTQDRRQAGLLLPVTGGKTKEPAAAGDAEDRAAARSAHRQGDTARRQRRDPGGHHLATALLSRRVARLRSRPAARQAEERRAVEAARLRAVLLHPHVRATGRKPWSYLPRRERRDRHARHRAQSAPPGRQSAGAGELRCDPRRTRQARGRVLARHDGAAPRRLTGGRLLGR